MAEIYKCAVQGGRAENPDGSGEPRPVKFSKFEKILFVSAGVAVVVAGAVYGASEAVKYFSQ
jgi:hypothetical protein|tara:strand:+ start:147 stop:332 length:186 start_codon:yes stop_codon:yes gene_type:complete